MEVIAVRWTCGRIEVNDWIPHNVMSGEVTSTRWYLCFLTHALLNYLAITYHFNGHDCLKIYLNYFYFSVPYFLFWLIINKILLLQIPSGNTLVLQILYDSLCNIKLALFGQGIWHIYQLTFWNLSSAFIHIIANSSTSKNCNLIE